MFQSLIGFKINWNLIKMGVELNEWQRFNP